MTEGTGNVFADLGLPEPEARLAKAQIALSIAQVVRRAGWTQSEAAAMAGVPQPQVSRLLRGQLEGFSVERLFRILNALGQDVEIVVGPARSAAGETRIRTRRASPRAAAQRTRATIG